MFKSDWITSPHLIVKIIGRTYVLSIEMNKDALPLILSKQWEVQISTQLANAI